jgi:hypothetical protein
MYTEHDWLIVLPAIAAVFGYLTVTCHRYVSASWHMSMRSAFRCITLGTIASFIILILMNGPI